MRQLLTHLKNGGPRCEHMGLRARSGTVLARDRQAADTFSIQLLLPEYEYEYELDDDTVATASSASPFSRRRPLYR